MKTALASCLLVAIVLCAAPAPAAYTVSRPVDNLWGVLFDHSYTANDDWSCVESFAGECSCAGQNPCVWWQHGAPGDSCTSAWFNAHWIYGIEGVCHQATNNNAWYMGSDVVSWSLRGMGWSTALWGNYGTDGGC
jgi:hypothetical protein